MASQFKSLEELNAEFLQTKQMQKEEKREEESHDSEKVPDDKVTHTNVSSTEQMVFPEHDEEIEKLKEKLKEQIEEVVEEERIETAAEEAVIEEKTLQDGEVEVHDREPSKKTKRIVKIATDVIFYLVIIVVLAGSVIFASSKSPDKSIFGYRFYEVLTPSMSPAYDPGDLIIVKLTNPEEIQVDDVMTFSPGKDGTSYLTHRVIEKIENYEDTGRPAFRTKGDAN